MRRLFFAILIMMTMVTANSQTLTERQKAPIEREQSYACIDFAESTEVECNSMVRASR
jgi:hypothetical protein